MDTVLVVGSEKTAAALAKLLVPSYFGRTVYALSASMARRIVSKQEWSLIVVAAPLPDEAANVLAADLAHQYNASVLLLSSAVQTGDEGVGYIVLETPVNRIILENTLRVLSTTRRCFVVLKEENRRLASKLEEARLVGRAKCALVAYRQMTENQAHHYIEKQAMDRRLPRRDVAKDILSVFEG